MNTPSRPALSDRIGKWFAIAAGLWLLAATILLALVAFGTGYRLWWPVAVYMGFTVLASLICFVMYGLDKRRAKLQARRIPERTLHGFALVGGWPGALWAQRIFRHKTQKKSFRLFFWMIVLLHLIVLGYTIYWTYQNHQDVITREPPPAQAAP